MLAEYTEFLFENKDKDNFVELAIDKLLSYLPEDEQDIEFAKRVLRLMESELHYLPNGITVNTLLHVVCKDGERINLTQTEVKIIEMLVANKGRVVKHNDIINKIWGYAEDNSILKVNISNIRNKINLDIVSEKGIGYRIA